jgi:hypothetical protein
MTVDIIIIGPGRIIVIGWCIGTKELELLPAIAMPVA